MLVQPISVQEQSTNQKSVDDFNWHNWQVIPAVKHQQFIKVNSDIIHRMTTRAVDTLNNLCQQADKTRNYYQQLTATTKRNG